MSEIQPFVSIIIPVYNTGKYVLETLDSIVNQTYPLAKIQVVLIDDGSKDNSVELIETWLKDHTIVNCTIVINEKNLGLNKTLNKGAKLYAKHEYVIFIGDDILMPDRVEKQVAALLANPAMGFCFSDMEIIDAAGIQIAASYLKYGYKVDLNNFGTENLYERVLQNNVVPAPSVMHRKSVMEEVGYFDEELTFEDLDMSLKILKKYKAVFVPLPLVKYRVVSGSLSDDPLDNVKHVRSFFLVYQKHLGGHSDESLVKKLDWYLERMYKLNQPNLKVLASDYMSDYCKNKALVNFIKWRMPYLTYRIIRKLKIITNFG